jgi:hypothetical protein
VTDPNANASAESVADSISGTDGNGNPLPFDQVAMFYDSNLFGLGKDYAFPEVSNTSPSEIDHVTSLAKLWTRSRKMADGNTYDAHDALFTVLKSVLLANPTINNDEPNSVNYKAPTTS